MSRVLFSFWFRIQRIIKNCPGYCSASGSVFCILFKIALVIIQRLVQDSAYSRSQHRSRTWEAPRMSQPGLSGLNGAQAAGKSRESKIAQKQPHQKLLKRVREKSRECHNHKPQPFPDPKFAFYSKMNQVQNCSELTTHTKIDFKRSSAPRLNIAQVAWSPTGLYGLNSAKAAEKFPESKIGPEIGLKTQRTRSQHRS